MYDLKVVQPLLDFCLDNPERVISIEVTDAQAKEGVVKVTVIIICTIIITTSSPSPSSVPSSS